MRGSLEGVRRVRTTRWVIKGWEEGVVEDGAADEVCGACEDEFLFSFF